jgi:hypothetical protein
MRLQIGHTKVVIFCGRFADPCECEQRIPHLIYDSISALLRSWIPAGYDYLQKSEEPRPLTFRAAACTARIDSPLAALSKCGRRHSDGRRPCSCIATRNHNGFPSRRPNVKRGTLQRTETPDGADTLAARATTRIRYAYSVVRSLHFNMLGRNFMNEPLISNLLVLIQFGSDRASRASLH